MSEHDVVGRSHAHDSARQHVTGAAIYLDDMAASFRERLLASRAPSSAGI